MTAAKRPRTSRVSRTPASEDVTADTGTDAQADVTDDVWTPTPSSYPQALPFTIDRPEVGVPMTDAEITAFTEKMLALTPRSPMGRRPATSDSPR